MKNSKTKKKLEEILSLLQKANFFPTKKFLNNAEKLNISKATLRRQLHQLEKWGYISLTYGQIEVVRKEFLNWEHSTQFKNINHYKALAFRANALLKDEENIFVSGGKTMEMFVKNIQVNINLLCTNSLSVALFAINNNYIKEVILIGGRVAKDKKICVGTFAKNMIDKLIFNAVFTGFDSYDDNQIYLNNINDNNVIKYVINRTEKINVFGAKEKRMNQGLVKLLAINKANHFVVL